jgi:hypothetical protein
VYNVLADQAEPEDPGGVTVSRPSDALVAQAALNTLFLGLRAVALLVGAIGVANIMVIAVLERRSEIGLPQAPGATRAHIRIQFLAEAIVLSVACDVAGILVGAAATASTPTARPGPPSSPPTDGRPAWLPPRSSAPSPGCCPPSAQPACHPSSLSTACDPSVVRPTPPARGLVGQSCGPADVRNARRPLPYLTVRGQHQLSTLSGTGGNQPGITSANGRPPESRVHGPSQTAPAP